VASGQDEIEKGFASDLASGPGASTKVLQMYPVGDDVCAIVRGRLKSVVIEEMQIALRTRITEAAEPMHVYPRKIG